MADAKNNSGRERNPYLCRKNTRVDMGTYFTVSGHDFAPAQSIHAESREIPNTLCGQPGSKSLEVNVTETRILLFIGVVVYNDAY
jgi:hypothetical protein